MLNREEIHIYYDGLKEGLWRHAWWKDGVQYVGNMGTTLEEAVAKADRDRERALAQAR